MPEEVKKHVVATQKQIIEYTNRVIELIETNHTSMQIVRILMPELNKCERQIKTYIAKATALLKEEQSKEVAIKRAEMMLSIQKDMNEAYSNYKSSNNIKWFKVYMECKDRLKWFEPDQLQQKGDDTNTQKIEITFTEAKKDD